MKALLTLPLLFISLITISQDVEHIRMVAIDKPIVKVDINGKKAFFLVDTGADISVINSGSIEKYDLEESKIYSNSARAISFNGNTSSVMRVKNAQLTLAENFDHQDFFSMDLSRLIEVIKAKTTIRITGILGADLLLKYHCIIDYNQRQITMVNGRSKRRLASK
ncbi:MAG: aspartyl protease family protein [Ekhidna sp.]